MIGTGPPHEFVSCDLWTGHGETPLPPGPDNAIAYLAFGPGGSLRVREDGYVRLGPGTVIEALEGGGFTITIPGEADPVISHISAPASGGWQAITVPSASMALQLPMQMWEEP